MEAWKNSLFFWLWKFGFSQLFFVDFFVTLKITETDPGVRGDTASGGSKPATLETGAVVKVPLFVEQDEVIKVDTRTAEYVGRAKD